MKSSLLFVLIFIQSLGQLQASDSNVIDAAKCAQDIVDFKYAGPDGLAFAASIVNELEARKEKAKEILDQCESFRKKSPRWKMSRARQIEILASLRETMNDRGYFFLRGAIRPLIVCVRQSLVRSSCKSATGKKWLETGSHLQSGRDLKTYRLGHSETVGGVIVLGPQDEFSDEDREYIQTLPTDFAGVSMTALTQELSTEYVRLKIWKLPYSTEFIRHYFLKTK